VHLACGTPRQRGVTLWVSGVAIMGASLLTLQRGAFAPGSYVMTVGFGAAIVGTVEATR